MSYVDSYLAQVGRHLSARQRDDILRELRSSIEDQITDLAGNREPGHNDEKAVLRRLGHPLKVASGYSDPRYLIGPELFPFFLQTLKTVLLVVGLIQVAVVMTAYVSTGYTTQLAHLFTGVFDTLLWASVITLVVFVSIEYSGDQLGWYDSWKPESLSLTDSAPINRSDLMTNLITEAVFLLWWNNVLILQRWLPGPNGDVTISLTAVWDVLYWPLNLLFGSWLVLHLAVLLRGLWRPIMLWLELALGCAGLAVSIWLLSHRPLMTVTGNAGDNAEVIVNRVVISVIVVCAVAIVWDMWLASTRLLGRHANRRIGE